MLSDNPNAIEFHVKLNEQAEQITRLTNATERMSQLMFKLVDKMTAHPVKVIAEAKKELFVNSFKKASELAGEERR